MQLRACGCLRPRHSACHHEQRDHWMSAALLVMAALVLVTVVLAGAHLS